MLTVKHTSSSKRLSNMGVPQQLQELAIKLQCAEQEIQIMKLEKIEYEQELYQIKQENEQLIQENESYTECSQLDRQEMVFLRKTSASLHVINDSNYDLQTQISEYKKLVKTLTAANNTLQKQNQKYVIAVEQLTQQTQKRQHIHSNNTLNLQNKIKELEHETDSLRQELNAIKLAQTYCELDSGSEEKQYENMESIQLPPPKYRRDSDIMNVKTRKNSEINNTGTATDGKPLFFELENVIDTGNYSNESVFILNQLLQFGYNENDIITAINDVNNKCDINEIVENIENNIECQCGNEIEKQMKEMERMESINNENRVVIKTLQKKIKILKERNQKLNVKRHIKNNESCFTFSWFSK